MLEVRILLLFLSVKITKFRMILGKSLKKHLNRKIPMGNILIAQKRKEKEFDFSALYICDDMF